MYSNSKKGFSILDLLVKIIFAALIIFILIWLFQKKIPNLNMKPFYGNVFRENIKYMQDAGENYFTNDKLPTSVGETIKLSLEEMEQMNLLVPFVDKDGNSCDIKNSYVAVTKLEVGYELKTNLVCGKEVNHVTKILGCHNYCENSCDNKCKMVDVIENEFKKVTEGKKTVYSCAKGYKLSGKYCIKSTLVKSKKATAKTGESKTETKAAIAKVISGTKKLIATTVTDKKVQLTTNVSTKKVQLKTVSTPGEEELTVNKTTTTEKYDCEKTKYETQCKDVVNKVPRTCNCKIVTVNGVPTQTCSVCYDTVVTQSCKDVPVKYTGTCTKEVTNYSCPTGTTRSTGSNATLKCYKSTTKYSCPAGTDVVEGTGSNTKCYKNEKTYSCPTGTTIKEGSGSNLKCYKTEKVYSCPKDADVVEGVGSNTKCYKVTKGSVKYECESGWTLNNKTCSRKVPGNKYYVCTDKGYKLVGDKCNLYKTTKVKAKSKKVNTKKVSYKWSTKDSLKGYTKTGNTRVKETKKVCE